MELRLASFLVGKEGEGDCVRDDNHGPKLDGKNGSHV